MNRRGFLGSILALGAAPAIVRADSLMRIVPRDTTVFTIEGVIGPDGSLMHFTSADLAICLDEFTRRYMQPAMSDFGKMVAAPLRIREPNRYTLRRP